MAPPRDAPADHTPLPDAEARNWVDARAPAALRPWLKLGRFDRPAGTWLLLLPCWWSAALAREEAHLGWGALLRLFALFAAGAVVMRAAGCAFNDVADRDIDRRVARTAGRPVASGAVSRKAALAYAVALSLLGLLVLLQLRPAAIALGVGSVALVAAYPFMKRITWWPQAWLGLTFNWGALVGWAATTGRVEAPALLLYAAGVAWTLGYDTVYALQDLEDDALAGVKSSARRLGKAAPRGVALFYAVAALLAAAALAAAHARAPAWFAWLLFAGHLARQASRVRLDDPAGALRVFRSNREAGLILLAACLLAAA